MVKTESMKFFSSRGNRLTVLPESDLLLKYQISMNYGWMVKNQLSVRYLNRLKILPISQY